MWRLILLSIVLFNINSIWCDNVEDTNCEKGDQNSCPTGQKLGCGDNCNRKCSNFFKGTSPIECAGLQCRNLTCQCDPEQDYYYDPTKQACVPSSECPKEVDDTTVTPPVADSCAIGQKLGCGDNCNRKCSNFFKGTSPIECARLQCSNLTCQCDPEQDYYYDPTKQACVPSSECPKEVDDTTVTSRVADSCPTGQKLGCGDNCNRKCSNFFKGTSPIECAGLQCRNLTCQCDPEQDFYYDPTKQACVPSSECPKEVDDTTVTPPVADSCPIGQKLGCGDNCNRKCSNFFKGTSPIECAGLQCRNLTCQCDPEQDYYYDPTKQACVPSSECPKEVDDTTVTPPVADSCPIGQKLGCGDNCNRKCSNFFKGTSPIECARLQCRNLTCQCDPEQDYYYDPTKQACVPSSECPKEVDDTTVTSRVADSCPTGQKLGCGDNCNRKCSNYFKGTSPIECAGLQCRNLTCQCDPEQDFYYDPTKQACVPSSECPKEVDDTTVTPPVADSCPIGQKLGCGDNCNRKCSNFFKGTSPIECARLQCRNLTCQCDPEQDFYYDPTKQACVPSSECPKEVDDTTVTSRVADSCPTGQKLGCGDNCNRKCSNFFKGTSPIECAGLQCRNLTCQCDPEQDYYYDPTKQACVPSSECPKEVTTAVPVDDSTVTTPIQCGINEEYSNCTQIICRAQKCEEKGKSVACPAITPGSCIRGCVCKDNFLKGSNNSCIPQEDCPTDNILDDFRGSCPVGQKLGCGNNCNRKCSNYYHGTSRFGCPRYQCTTLTCQCDPSQGYYYNPTRNTCVPASECPKDDDTSSPVADVVPTSLYQTTN